MHGFMYILRCADGSYYVGSTTDLERRVAQHQRGEGANHTRKHGPVELVYSEWYPRVDQAFYREKQVQGWSRKKKEALIKGEPGMLPELAKAYRDVRGQGTGPSSASGPGSRDASGFERPGG
jgi:putative endonuclease